MPHLTISLLGAFEVRLEGQIIQHFESVKVRALLAYLARAAARASAAPLLDGVAGGGDALASPWSRGPDQRGGQ